MKTSIKTSLFYLVVVVLLSATQLQAQSNTFPSSGNVGIGTSSPSKKLEISDTGVPEIQLTKKNGHGSYASLGRISFYEGHYDNAISSKIEGTRGPGGKGRGELSFSTLETSGGNLEERMRITYQGNVGIGTSSPSKKLEISDTGVPEIQLTKKNGHGSYASLGRLSFYEGHYDNAISSRIEGTRGPGGKGRGELSFSTLETSGGNLEERMRITYQGNVGIGTTAPSQKLSVAGTINSEEIIVEENVGADFVFEASYDLPTLQDIEAFIEQNQHLPGIAPASQMIEEGVKVGELQMQLLQKIEELTLYTIEQQKLIEATLEQNQSLVQKNYQLEQRIQHLEHHEN